VALENLTFKRFKIGAKIEKSYQRVWDVREDLELDTARASKNQIKRCNVSAFKFIVVFCLWNF